MSGRGPSACVSEDGDAPAPVLPTTPTFSPARISSEKLRTTVGSSGRYLISTSLNTMAPCSGQVGGGAVSTMRAGASCGRCLAYHSKRSIELMLFSTSAAWRTSIWVDDWRRSVVVKMRPILAGGIVVRSATATMATTKTRRAPSESTRTASQRCEGGKERCESVRSRREEAGRRKGTARTWLIGVRNQALRTKREASG